MNLESLAGTVRSVLEGATTCAVTSFFVPRLRLMGIFVGTTNMQLTSATSKILICIVSNSKIQFSLLFVFSVRYLFYTAEKGNGEKLSSSDFPEQL